MAFELSFKAHNMVSVQPYSSKPGPVNGQSLNVIFHLMVSIYRLVKFETSSMSLHNSKTANLENTSLPSCGDQTILSHIVVFLF